MTFYASPEYVKCLHAVQVPHKETQSCKLQIISLNDNVVRQHLYSSVGIWMRAFIPKYDDILNMGNVNN